MSAVSYEDDGRDHAQGMIDWLRGQSPDVWHDAASNLNWDNAERVLDWVVSQPNCDKATAARIFWAANPLYYMRALATAEWRSEQHLRLVTKIIRNWKSGFYKRADLVWREDHRVDYRLTRENLGGSDPLAIPPELLAPWKGRNPFVPEAAKPENNLVLWELYSGLGTDMGPKPGSDWKPQELKRGRAEIWAGEVETLRFYKQAAPWLAAFAVVAMSAAMLLRYIFKGSPL